MKNTGKTRLILLAVALLFVLSLVCLASCNGDSGRTDDGTHTHVWEHHASDAYLKSEADCTHPRVYYVSCKTCSEKGTETFTDGDALGHTGGTATCRDRAVCLRCGESYGELSDEHQPGDTPVVVEPTCTEPGSETFTCAVCGKEFSREIPPTHTGEWVVIAAPRCFDDGEKQRVCTVCGALESEPIPMYNAHDFGGASCSGGDKCRRCNYIEGDGLGHDFGAWEIVEEASCTANGKRVRRCSRCSAEKEDIVPMTGHDWETAIVTPSTCKTRGEGKNTCRRCRVSETVSLPLAPHSGEWTVTREPTCSATGTEERTCTVCGHSETRIVAKAPHTFDAWTIEKWRSCTENGLELHICTTCRLKETRVIPAAHSLPDDWTVVREASCSATGTRTKACMVEGCDYVLTETLPKKPHTFGEWQQTAAPSCTENGRNVRTCSVCRHSEEQILPKRGHIYEGGDCETPAVCKVCGNEAGFGHSFGEWREIEQPDCGRYGYRMRVCTKCKKAETEKTDPVGHTFDTSAVFREPTCSVCGILRLTCSVCGKITEEDIEKTDHTYGAWQNDPDHAPTCTEGGRKFRLCTACDHREEGDIPSLGHNFPEGTCYTENACTRCGVREKGHVYTDEGCARCGAKFTSDATFVLSADQTHYSMTSIGTIPEGVTRIIIRPIYNGLPVKAIKLGSEYQNQKYPAVEIIIPDGVEKISDDAFRSFVNMTSVHIPDSVTYIGQDAFRGCTSLTAVRIPGGVATIGKAAFNGCTRLATVEIADGVTVIELGAFEWCTSLATVHIPGSVRKIRYGAFEGCTSLATVTLADGVETIGQRAFAKTAVTEIVLPDTLKKLDVWVFLNCTSLESVVIPAGMESVWTNAFSGCTALARVTFRNPDGWQVSASEEMTDAVSIPADDLRDPAKAAQTLMRYSDEYYYWKRT